ncbi:MAG: hypothetical protein H6729_00175 [Deltaproteobacteria bacterium]|nr:hypothetical protein [Deltaproteobacteria bacterium]
MSHLEKSASVSEILPSTTSRRPKAFPRRWVIPLAMLVPLGAIVFAFSLGPSEEKRLEAFYLSKSDAEASRVLASLGPVVVPSVAANLARDTARYPHRSLSIEFLGLHGGDAAKVALRSLIQREQASTQERALALKAYRHITMQRAARLARNYSDRTDALGTTAREIMKTQEPRPLISNEMSESPHP